MKRKLSLGVVITALMQLFCTAATASAQAELVDRIVAVVNEDIVLLSELEERMRPFAQRIRTQGFDRERERKMLYQMREEMINRLVDEKLTDQEIARNKIQVDEKEIDQTIERIKSANSYTDEDLRSFLKRDKMTMQQYRDKVKDQMLRSRLVNYQVRSKIVITEEEIKTYYDNHAEQYRGKTTYHLRILMIVTANLDSDTEKKAAMERMELLRARVLDGESFADLAQAYSQGPAANEGGDLGQFEMADLSPQIQKALEGVQAGQPTGIVETDQALQLFYLEAINRREDKSLDSVRAEIQEKLFNEVVNKQFVAWLEELRSQSHIKIVN